jgi:ribonuclease HI
MMLKIYCDGACSGNPGPGGWGAVLLYGEHHKNISGYEKHTTNNRMELTAAIEGLRALKRQIPVAIYTDSQYVRNGITKWIHTWLRSNWRNNSIKNVDLWQELYRLSQEHTIEWHWVKGHNGDKYNEIADELARMAIEDNR